MFNSIATQKNQEAQAETKAERKVFLPAVNVYETKDHIVLLADMPGVDEKSVDLTLENNVLTIQGRSTAEEPQGHRLAYAEYAAGDYRRSFTLSERVNREGIQATVKNGILKVTLSKAEAVKPQRIEIKAQ